MAGNHPFNPGDAPAKGRIGSDNDRSIRNSRRSTTGARLSDGAGPYPNGVANGPQPNNMAALQRAAKKRLLGNNKSTSPGTSTYKSNRGN